MPAPYPRRDWQQRADRALGRTGRGNQQGRFVGARPVINSPVGNTTNTVDERESGELHKIDAWTVADDSDATFTTSFEPLEDSWNLMLNGLRVHRSEFSVSGRTVTIATPTDLFLGADTQGSPWDLEIQYDYFVPALDPAEVPQSVHSGDESTNPVVSFGVAPTLGSSVLLVWRSKFGGGSISSISGLAATWTEIETQSVFEVYLGTGCNGLDTAVTLTAPAGLSTQMLEINRGLTASGAITATTGSATTVSETASNNGVALLMISGGSGVATSPDSAAWTASASGAFSPVTRVKAASSGEFVGATASSAWTDTILAILEYA